METTIGVFATRLEAEAAAQELRSIGIGEEHLTLMEPRSSLAQTSSVNPPQPEAPGACGANQENVQGAILGFAGGLLGSTILVLALPGIGAIAAVGALGLSSAMGSIAGGVIGQAAHEATVTEITPQEFLTYESALQQGKYLLIVPHNGESSKHTITRLLERHGAEDFDRACDQWWANIRAQEVTEFAGSPEEFASVERTYRKGFESALVAYGRSSTCSDATSATNTQSNALLQEDVYKRGYARGRQYYEAMIRQYTHKEEQSARSV